MKRSLSVLLAVVAILISCEPETYLFVDEKPLSFSAEGGGTTIDLVANKNWSVSSDNSWCVVSPGSGGGDAGGIRLTVTCNRNENYDERIATITISCAEMMKRVSVTQSAKGIVVIEKSEYELSYEPQRLEIPLMTNTKDYKVTVISGGEWIKVADTKGLEKSSFSLDIEENEQKDREGVVYVTTSNDVITLKIKQADGTITIPDANFRKYCIDNFDKNGDGAISYKEARAVQRIDVLTDDIESLQGIEYFINLLVLSCRGSGWNSSQQKYIYGKLSSLDISKNVVLRELNCNYNELTSLDVSRNTGLTSLFCDSNQLTSLDVSNNTALTDFGCSSNQLTSLDVSRNTLLQGLYCDSNQMTSLDVSNNSLLERLHCTNETMTDLFLAQGQTFKESNWYSGTKVHYLAPNTGQENGHIWVDLGLPSGLKWATCNVGASASSDYGSYFAWGETTTKETYTWTNYRFRLSGDSSENVTFSKYNTSDNKKQLEWEDDAASANWGGSWRMPTETEWVELAEKCMWTWTTQGGKNGRKVTSKTNGNSIFLPLDGNEGEYWSSSCSLIPPFFAEGWYFTSEMVTNLGGPRYIGNLVRPVTQ